MLRCSHNDSFFSPCGLRVKAVLIGRLFVVFSIAIGGAPFFCGAHEEAPLFVVHTHLSLQTRRVLQQGVRISRTFSALQVVHAPHSHLHATPLLHVAFASACSTCAMCTCMQLHAACMCTHAASFAFNFDW